MAVMAHFRDYVRNLLARPIVLSPDQSSSIVLFLEAALLFQQIYEQHIVIATPPHPGSISPTRSDGAISRSIAISFTTFRKASSKLTFVLWPAIAVECLTTSDFIGASITAFRDRVYLRCSSQTCLAIAFDTNGQNSAKLWRSHFTVDGFNLPADVAGYRFAFGIEYTLEGSIRLISPERVRRRQSSKMSRRCETNLNHNTRTAFFRLNNARFS